MEIEMVIKGLMIDPITNMPIVLLRDPTGQKLLPIWVGVFEANAIALQLENVQTPRPMTHDLLTNVIGNLGAHVTRIVVSDLRDNTYYARIKLECANGHIEIDARPSDAIALALRTQATIFVDETVLQASKTTEIANENVDINRLKHWLEELSEEKLGKYKM
jgi:hypothetical protein